MENINNVILDGKVTNFHATDGSHINFDLATELGDFTVVMNGEGAKKIIDMELNERIATFNKVVRVTGKLKSYKKSCYRVNYGPRGGVHFEYDAEGTNRTYIEAETFNY